MTDTSHRVTELYIASPYWETRWLLLAVSPQVGLINPDIIHFRGQRSRSLPLVNSSGPQRERGQAAAGGLRKHQRFAPSQGIPSAY